jgi:hypothetical protein
MRTFLATALSALLAGAVWAAEPALTPPMQATLDAQKTVIAAWAADPAVIAAVTVQNAKGPIAGMDNAVWKTKPSNDPAITAFQQNPAGVVLTQKVRAGDGMFTEAFLCGAKGEKVAFVEKTSRYLHAGDEKFDVPMRGQDWQGKPEFDESSRAAAVQIATPVLADGKPIGVLVVGVSLARLAGR